MVSKQSLTKQNTLFLDKLYKLNKDLIEKQQENLKSLTIDKNITIYTLRGTNAASSFTLNRKNTNKTFYLTAMHVMYYFETQRSISALIYDGTVGAYAIQAGKLNFDLSGTGSFNFVMPYVVPIPFNSDKISMQIGTPISANDKVTCDLIGYEE
jgi:hypothetical protein